MLIYFKLTPTYKYHPASINCQRNAIIAAINNLALDGKGRGEPSDKNLSRPLNKNKATKDSGVGKSKSQEVTKVKITNEELQTHIQKEVEKQLENRVAQSVAAKLPITINK